MYERTELVMNFKCFFGQLLLLAASIGGMAQTIDIRVSVKIILSPATGARPSGIPDSVFYKAETNANRWMTSYSRGYRFRITEIVEIGGPSNGSFTGPSQWFGTDFRADPEWSDFQDLTKSDSRYRLRSNQINVYVATGFSNPGNSGGGTPIPPGDLNTAVQIFPDDGAWWLCHELGHFFGLHHIFSGEDRSSCSPGDDGLSDVLPDSNCWKTQDDVAFAHFLLPYNLLTGAQREQVDDEFFNVMSYHDAVNKNTTENRLGEAQLDREADEANSDRAAFVTGRTIFTSVGGLDALPGTQSFFPKKTVGGAVAAASASGTDIVLFRAGHYPGAVTVSKPVTFRATRVGSAFLGD